MNLPVTFDGTPESGCYVFQGNPSLDLLGDLLVPFVVLSFVVNGP